MTKKQFLKIVAKNVKEVKRWPKWKQHYVITAETALTGRFLKCLNI